ncbi:uncharacterized protein LOC119308923 [Triticum dicoccoides]|uniref:uncharacterized protein LOC119308923 n=1 Tax=Triticum dicoccoides TaxID=85692 RepID=UPI001891B481|nr:uncharacterized protein LOC119308923 [Triticum dicoccoides]
MTDQEHEEVVRWLARIYGWLKKGKKLAKGMSRFTASSPSRISRTPSFPDLRDLIERLARRADAVTLAALLGAALLLYIIRRSGADADEEEEEEGIVLTARLPPSARRRLVLVTLPLVPRGPGARRPPWAWSLRFVGHAAAAVHPQRLIFSGRHGRTEQLRFLAGSHGVPQHRSIFAGSLGRTAPSSAASWQGALAAPHPAAPMLTSSFPPPATR